MKAANINAVRTSALQSRGALHGIVRRKGMYILDEVPYCWINDQVKEVSYAPFLMQRARETLARDKNRPSVVAWSLGNENPMGIASQMTLDLVRQLDPTRPAFVSAADARNCPASSGATIIIPAPIRCVSATPDRIAGRQLHRASAHLLRKRGARIRSGRFGFVVGNA